MITGVGDSHLQGRCVRPPKGFLWKANPWSMPPIEMGQARTGGFFLRGTLIKMVSRMIAGVENSHLHSNRVIPAKSFI